MLDLGVTNLLVRHFKSLDYVVVGAFVKIFNTKSKEVATGCMGMFNCPLLSACMSNTKSNIFCAAVRI